MSDTETPETPVEPRRAELGIAFQDLQKINTDLWAHIAFNSPGMSGELTREFHQRYLEVEQQLGAVIASAPVATT